MGLDWNPVGKPLPGHDEEFERLFWLLTDQPDPKATRLQRLKAAFRAPNREAAQKRFEEIQVSPYVTLGAPQVGHDPVATQWARQRFAEIKSGKKTEDEFLESMKGYFALALVPPCDGLPWYTNGKAGYVEICSFRAEWIILECRSIIPRALADNCYKSCLPPEFEALGKALRQIAKQYSSENSAQHVEALRELPETSSVAERRSHILFSAAKWCHWWSSRGHGLEAYA